VEVKLLTHGLMPVSYSIVLQSLKNAGKEGNHLVVTALKQ
jgi:hypothetical protein